MGTKLVSRPSAFLVPQLSALGRDHQPLVRSTAAALQLMRREASLAAP